MLTWTLISSGEQIGGQGRSGFVGLNLFGSWKLLGLWKNLDPKHLKYLTFHLCLKFQMHLFLFSSSPSFFFFFVIHLLVVPYGNHSANRGG